MFIKKITMAAVGFLFASNAMAGAEDWNGVFTVQDPNGHMQTVNHTPRYVSFMFFTVGRCLNLSRGSTVNDLTFNQDISLCVNSSVEQFTNEVQKIGPLVNKNVTLGPTYQ